MARGWDSKSVEEQQSQFQQQVEGAKPARSADDARRARHIQALELQLAQVRQRMQQSANPRYNELLQRELEYLQRELAALRGA